MSIRILTAENILELHDRLIAKHGGLYGVRDEDLFLFLCDAPYQQFGGQDLYHTVIEKAAKYIDGFARHQVFFDGNKRVAAASAMFLLKENGYIPTYKAGELADLTLTVANTDISFEDIADNIREHVCQ